MSNKGSITVMVRCEGVSPLLMNMPHPELLQRLRTKVAPPKRLDQSVEDEAREKVYMEGDKIGLPTINLLSCLVAAGREVKIGARQSISTATSTRLYSYLSIPGTFISFDNGTTWVPDVRRGRNQGTKEKVMICIVRPRFDQWSFTVEVTVDTSKVTLETARKLFDVAGDSVGLCEFRPSCKGPYGRFKVVEWNVREASE